MRMALAGAALGAMALAGCGTYGYGGGYGGGTQLSQCMRNALVGAGVGAVVGGVTAPEGNRGENAAIGAVVGGGATYGACRLLDANAQSRIETAYVRALNADAPITESWVSGAGRRHVLEAPRPTVVSDGCRRINATLTVNDTIETLPAETYCATGGGWRPA